ncbi:type III secretion system inner membrane ring lipoprotein SctJ [Ralstonia mojiangensis]
MMMATPTGLSRWLRFGLACAAALLLCSCDKELVSNLGEPQANEVLSALSNAGIGARKEAVDERGWQVLVDDSDMGQALDVLRAQGLPREPLARLGEIFRKQGLVATPAEERVRYLYGMSEELSRTLQAMDGVVTARVHVVIPENDPLSDKVRPSSAAVYIKYREGVNLRAMTPMVKDLVAHSIEGLNYDNVSLVLQGTDLGANERRSRAATSPYLLINARNPLVWLVGVLIVLGVLAVLATALRRGWEPRWPGSRGLGRRRAGQFANDGDQAG